MTHSKIWCQPHSCTGPKSAAQHWDDMPQASAMGPPAHEACSAAGNVPPMADLGQLEGLEARVQAGHSESPMIDGKKWDGAKAYKDSKVCNMLTMGELHRHAPRLRFRPALHAALAGT